MHRRCHGRLVGRLPRARVDPSPAGYRDSDPGRRSLRESAIDFASALSGHDVAHGASGGNGVRIHDVRLDVRSAAGRLGNAVGGALSDRPVWVPASAFYPAARCDAVCGAAEGAHDSRIPLFPDVHRSLWGDSVSHADRAGRNPEADGALEYSANGALNHRFAPITTLGPLRRLSTRRLGVDCPIIRPATAVGLVRAVGYVGFDLSSKLGSLEVSRACPAEFFDSGQILIRQADKYVILLPEGSTTRPQRWFS